MDYFRLLRARVLFVLVLLSGASLVAPAHAQLAPLLGSSSSADLATLTAHQAADQRWSQQLSVQLGHKPDSADAQLLLGLLTGALDRRQAHFARALQLAPQSRALAWIYALTCGFEQDHCPQRFRPLQRLAPDNAAAWMQKLAIIPIRSPAPLMPQFAAQRARIIEQIADKPQFDTYRIALIHRLLAALQGAPAYPAQLQASAAFTRWVFASALYEAWASSPFQGVGLACRPRPADARLQQACYRLGETMALRGDTLMANLIGSSVAITNAPDAGARKTAQARRRELQWLLSALRQAGDQPGFPARFLAQWDRYPREADDVRAIIAAAGLPTTPRPGWQPPAQR